MLFLLGLMGPAFADSNRKLIARKYFTAGYLEAQGVVYPKTIPKHKRLYDMIVKDIFYVRSTHGYKRLKDHLPADENEMKFVSCHHGGTTFISHHNIPNAAVVSETKKLINIACKGFINRDIDKVLGVRLQDESVIEEKAKKDKEDRAKKARVERAERNRKEEIEAEERKEETLKKKKVFDALFE